MQNKEISADENIWIVKPAHSSQGRGIYLLTELQDLPPTVVDNAPQRYVVSKYIYKPLLINGLKFDIRMYVLVTSLDPLRIYLYNEGLVRFASEPYQMVDKQKKFSHLTNYSVNKKSDTFVQNKNAA